MSERESGGGVFNIGSQQAGVINNVAGDQTIRGGQQGTAIFSAAEALAQLDRLKAATERLALPDADRREAAEAIESAQAELKAREPDKGRVAGHLERFASVLRQAGALLTAGESVVAPLKALAAWLGPLGAPLLSLLVL